ncbi:MAG TPA: hypothetical protein VJN94_06085 [Candidatus Binataceae bacterium]|nr:hypothetical protein [Candidatus Binataceae bacterium]
MRANRSRWLLSLALAGLICGCAESAEKPAAEQARASPAVVAANEGPPPGSANNVTGVWEGNSIAACWQITISNPGRCAARQKITFIMFQDGQTVTGHYRCRFGNQECRGLAETGIIRDGHMRDHLLRIRVMLDDDSMCFFTAMPQNDILEGSYTCQWGGPIEYGTFRAERSY